MRWSESELEQYLRRGHGSTCGAAMSEKVLQSAVMRLFKQYDYMVYHTFDARRSQPGFPDLVAVPNPLLLPDLVAVPDPLLHRRDCTMYMLELKREEERPTLPQQHWLAALARVERVEAQVLRPSGLEAFVTRLREKNR